MSWGRWSAPLLALGLVGAWYATKPLLPQPEWVSVGTYFGTCGERGRPFHCVSDGDTVTLGFGPNARRIRLTGFDAPEIEGRCEAESKRAAEAQRALQAWLNQGMFEWDGGDNPQRDRFGRELREVRRISKEGDEERLARHMIDADLAEGSGPWERRDWCG